ncbi:MAG: response regulator [Pedobacter sp.]|nr:MAG: response regulator [Pedobacter sp.]
MKGSILVVDNDIDMEDLLSELFSSMPYTFNFYEETDDIFELVSKHEPQLILLDYNLNGVNGGELCQQLKSEPATKDIPVILFSAYPRMIYALKNYGYDAFIEKPFDIDEFSNIIDGFMSSSISGNK